MQASSHASEQRACVHNPLTHTHIVPRTTQGDMAAIKARALAALRSRRRRMARLPRGSDAGRDPESFCLASIAVTKKPLARSHPYYESTLPSLSFTTFWA